MLRYTLFIYYAVYKMFLFFVCQKKEFKKSLLRPLLKDILIFSKSYHLKNTFQNKVFLNQSDPHPS